MSWARLDDRFHENRKIKRLWRRQPAALGLHVMAITYCAGHETDGFVDVEFVEEKVTKPAERGRMVEALIECGLWSPVEDGWRIHDFLEFNRSREASEQEREAARERMRRHRGRGAGSPERADTVRSNISERANGVRQPRPDPTRTTPPSPPQGELPTLPEPVKGNRERDRVERDRRAGEFRSSLTEFVKAALPQLDPSAAFSLAHTAITHHGLRDPEQVVAFVQRQAGEAAA